MNPLIARFAILAASVPLAAVSQAQTTGSITRHVWTGISGTAVADLTSLPAVPDSSEHPSKSVDLVKPGCQPHA